MGGYDPRPAPTPTQTQKLKAALTDPPPCRTTAQGTKHRTRAQKGHCHAPPPPLYTLYIYIFNHTRTRTHKRSVHIPGGPEPHTQTTPTATGAGKKAKPNEREREKRERRGSGKTCTAPRAEGPASRGRAGGGVPRQAHFLFFSWLASQSKPSYRPSPLVAHVAWMYQLRWRRECRPSLSVISAAFMALGRSWGEREGGGQPWTHPAGRRGGEGRAPRRTCLLAKTRSTASRNSSSASIRMSSSRASFTRSRSLLSTTKIRPGGCAALSWGGTHTSRSLDGAGRDPQGALRREGKAHTYPGCFGSSVAREAGSCPAHPRPTR